MPEPQEIGPVIRAFRIRIAKRPERHDPAASPRKPATLEERKRLRPIGRNNDRYQMMLDELRKLAVLADDTGARQATPLGSWRLGSTGTKMARHTTPTCCLCSSIRQLPTDRLSIEWRSWRSGGRP